MEAPEVSTGSVPAPFDHAATFDPAEPFDTFAKRVPAKWVVYLLADEAGRPVQLLCVRNLRYSLKRRLGPPELEETEAATSPVTPSGATRRVNYREIVRHVFWRRVDSAFEADDVYADAARVMFPGTYRGILGDRPAWFVHVDDAAAFPRYTRTTDLAPRPGVLLGPVEDKHVAGRLIQLVEDCFDLCRYYNILLAAPRGLACAYKDMGKCPAPCDGSISLPQYRRLIEWSVRVVVDPADYVREQTRRMQQAAGELRFEVAARIKAYIDQLAQLGTGPFRHVARLSDFQFLCFQRGPRPQTAKVFLITPGRIELMLCLRDEHFKPAELMREALTLAHTTTGDVDAVGAERIGVVAGHLFARKPTGVWLALATVDERKVAKAYRDVQKQAAVTDTDDEGVVKELAAL